MKPHSVLQDILAESMAAPRQPRGGLNWSDRRRQGQDEFLSLNWLFPTSSDDHVGKRINRRAAVLAPCGIRHHRQPTTGTKFGKVYPKFTQLTALAQSDQNSPGWLKIRTDDGTEGWIQQQFIDLTNAGTAVLHPRMNQLDKGLELLAHVLVYRPNLARKANTRELLRRFGYDLRRFVDQKAKSNEIRKMAVEDIPA